MALTVELYKRYEGFTLDVSFSTDGGVLSLFGASGSGKSLTLRCIAGVVKPDRGHIELDGTVLFDSKRGVNLPPQQRGVGYLFQNYALFPTMTAAKNIETGLMRVRDRKKRAGQVEALLHAYHLTAQAGLYPHQLSGGQQQRVALARALATKPCALLLDEPFSALDNHLRWQLEQELADTIETFPGTTLFISHSLGEVYRLSDRVCVLEDGKSRIAADKSELLLKPRTLSDALLAGLQNYSCADRTDAHTMYARAWGVELRSAKLIPEDATAVGIRAGDIRPGRADEVNALRCTVQRVTEDVETRVVTLLPTGAGAHLRSRLRMELEKDAPCPFAAGGETCVVLPEDAILCFREERG